ncbi:MAG: hypothetical protein AB7J13_07570 [Pyrinomonadaceae bacterium]
MTDKKTSGSKAKPRFEEEFAGLSLDEKIASLIRMEAATLSETVTYLANSSVKAVEKAGEIIQDVSEKIEHEVKKAAAAAGASATCETNGEPAKGKAAEPKAKPSAKRPPKPKDPK